MNQYDKIIVGSGFAGSVLAREFANDNQKVLVIEKRSHIGGNMYEVEMDDILVHQYGPHLFHTNHSNVMDYLNNYGEWYFYEHRVLGLIDQVLVPIPFNFKSIELLFSKEDSTEIKNKLVNHYGMNQSVSILNLLENEDECLKKFGQYVFEKVFIHYTAKQWNTSIENVDASVINRVPVIIGYDDRYFQDKYQFMPKNGYNEIFSNLLTHPNIFVRSNENALDLLTFDFLNKKVLFEGESFQGDIIYTGEIDELLNYKYGPLPYRSLKMVFEEKEMNYYQPSAVVNYPNEEDFTRITEFKYFNQKKYKENTIILKEYPLTYEHQKENNIPYYAILNDENNLLYQTYRNDFNEFSNLYFCGRLAEYKYYNMDAVILRAFEIYEEIKKNRKE